MNLRSRNRLIAMLVVVATIAIAGVVYADTVSLPNDNIPTNNIPPTKLAFLQNIEATEVAVQTAVPPASKTNNPPLAVSTQVWPTGIITDFSVPLPSEFYYISNVWQNVISGNHVQVYAGLEREKVDPPQGVLVVNTRKINLGDVSVTLLPSGEYLTPTQSGVLYIASVSGTCLTLGTDVETTDQISTPTTSQTFQFDVATRSWSCSVNQRPPP